MLLKAFLAGFDPAAEARVAALLQQCTALGARWRVGGGPGCDLWIVEGASARGMGDGVVGIRGAVPLRIRPAEMPHPVAFTEPLDASISTSHRFDAGSLQSLNVLLTRLARWLGPRLVQHALVAHLIDSGASFTRSNVVEVRDGRRLLALLDFEGDTAVAADAVAADVLRADWGLRPRGGGAPPGFRVARTQQVLWDFAQRCERDDLLPARYLRLPIHLRATPQLAPRELSDAALVVLRELAYGPRTFAELRALTQADDAVLARDLGALYLVGAITCDPGRSRTARERRRAADLHDSDLSFIGARPTDTAELTAPGFAHTLH